MLMNGSGSETYPITVFKESCNWIPTLSHGFYLRKSNKNLRTSPALAATIPPATSIGVHL